MIFVLFIYSVIPYNGAASNSNESPESSTYAELSPASIITASDTDATNTFSDTESTQTAFSDNTTLKSQNQSATESDPPIIYTGIYSYFVNPKSELFNKCIVDKHTFDVQNFEWNDAENMKKWDVTPDQIIKDHNKCIEDNDIDGLTEFFQLCGKFIKEIFKIIGNLYPYGIPQKTIDVIAQNVAEKYPQLGKIYDFFRLHSLGTNADMKTHKKDKTISVCIFISI